MVKFELIEFVTKDGLEHQGILHEPEKKTDAAVLWIHGLTGRFYSNASLMKRFAAECAGHGMAFASVNTRGHDYVTSTHKLDPSEEKGYRHERIGAGVEQFTDCVHDIEAAMDFLSGRGYARIILAGHSTGANKVCYYAALSPHQRLSGVVLSGPMSDRYSADVDPVMHEEHTRIMQKKLAEGKGDELLEGFDFFPLTPRRWMSLLAEGSPEDVFNYRDEKGALSAFGKIRVPLLVVFAGSDGHADRSIPEIRKAFDAHASSPDYRSIVIPDTDHGFTGKEDAFVSAIVDWAANV